MKFSFASFRNRQPSLIGQLLRWQVGAMTALWALLIVGLVLMMTRLENGDLDQRMTYFAQLLAQAAASGDPSVGAVEQRVRAVEDVFVGGVIKSLDSVDHYEARYAIRGADQEMLFKTAGFDPDWAQQVGIGRVRVGSETWHLVRLKSVDERFEVIVGESSGTRAKAMWPMLRIIGGSQLLIFVACVVAVWVAARRSLAPLREVATAIAARPAGAMQPIPSNRIPLEIAPLISEIDSLLTRERERLDVERGFLADAAHELRTPVAALQVQTHLLITQADADGIAAVTEVRQGLSRIAHLLDQLLVMARAESPSSSNAVEKELIDLPEFVRQRMATLVPMARERNIQLALEAPTECSAYLSRFRLTSILDNLLDNAVRYSPAHATVLVEILQSTEWIKVFIRDEGPGLTAEQRTRVFDRFYRIPREGTTGTGLGLAIVKSLASREGAQISIEDGLHGVGLSFILELSTL